MNAASGAVGCPGYLDANVTYLQNRLYLFYTSSSADYKTINAMLLDIKTKMTYTKVDKTLDAQGKAYEILRKLLPDWTNGKLLATGTVANVNDFVTRLYSLVCLAGPVPQVASGGGAGVITPTGGGLVVTTDKHAGVFFPAGAVTQNTTVTIAPVNTQLDTPLDQYAPTYEFVATPHDPAVPFGADLTVGVCVDPTIDATVFNRLKLAHNIVPGYVTANRFGNIEIMPTATTTALGLSCPTFTGPIGSASTLDRWKSFATALFLPEPLQASSAALLTTNLGGSTRTLSPFAAVDPRISLSINAGDGQTAVVGTNVAVPPSVLAKTYLGTKVPGVPVAFAVTAGGTISPTTNVLTDANGVAAATSWTLGPNPGANTASGTGQAISQITYSPTSVTFNATGIVAAPIDYGATGYRYQQSVESSFTIDTAGFRADGYNDSGWSLGDAAFGSAGDCSLNTNGSIKTTWDVSTDLLVRKRFTVAGGSPTARVSVAIDNDIKVYINGVDVTPNAKVNGGATSPSFDANGFAIHDGCPSQGSLTFDVSGLNPGSNLLVIEAHDRGTSSYLDVKVEATTVIQ